MLTVVVTMAVAVAVGAVMADENIPEP